MRLFLCEKPSQGKDIAAVVGATQRGDGCYTGPGVTVTWCIGHLLETASPEAYGEQYKSWNMNTLPILPAAWQVVVKPKTASQFKVIKKLLKEAKQLVISTDADREGEMIARELVEFCGYRGPIERLWLSALNDASIRQALANMKTDAETRPLYHSALARSRADWLIGMNFTRLFTLLARQVGFGGVLSVGRVQTPTLWLVVQRDRAIASFVPAPFWNVSVQLHANGQVFSADWIPDQTVVDDEGRCVDQRHAASVQQRLIAGKTAIAITVETERKREAPPLSFALSSLQEVCSSKFGFGVQETLNIAQALYETHKATTYPRTDTGYLPENMFSDVPAVLAALRRSDPALGPVLQSLNPALRSRAWNDKQVVAHHGIIPTTETPNLSAMSDKERAVYELIRMHYLAQFLPNHEYDRTSAEFDCEGLTLQAVGKSIAVIGWRSLITSSDDEEDKEGKSRSQVLPPLQNASRCQVQSSELKALKTQPPKPYTEGDLVKAMKQVAKYVTDPRLAQKLKETTGIGTEATRASIIQGLIDRGHLEKKGKSLRASESGASLIDAVPSALADPGTTAIWEQALSMIEAGTLTVDGFIEKQSTWITRLIEQYRGTTLAIKVPEGPLCPICSSKTINRHGKSGSFWACSTYPACKGSVNIEAPKKSASKTSRPRTART
ncbi:DNA topoisomerase-3 [Pseudomonas sp. JUb42]|uniref:DNA topoisomerase III n=1 Tax=Pseudomonas sp. JUb42 TaxID=2940611 RepID=UPI00216A2B91|nr:DNA topoisomerase III [Pseudomonas sp. JUb42]MCS3473046.1 DNA topoisomerase-3 [Pseudomonas sp. JUb42]